MSDNRRDFDIFEEQLRGVMYRGGPEADKVMCSTFLFIKYTVIFIVIFTAFCNICYKYNREPFWNKWIDSPPVETRSAHYTFNDEGRAIFVDENGKETRVFPD